MAMTSLLKTLTGAALAAAVSLPAAASGPVITPLSATAGVTHYPVAADGYAPPNFTPWQTDAAWWDTPNQSIVFAFDQAYQLSSALVTLDWNDVYKFEVSTDNVSYVQLFTTSGLWAQPANANVNAGQVTIPVSFALTANSYSYLRVSGVFGDGFYSVGEVSLQGVAVVPEPGTLAMMLAGAGVIVLRMRRRQQR